MALGTHGSAAEKAVRPDTDPESLLELLPEIVEGTSAVVEPEAVVEAASEGVVAPIVAVDESLAKL